MGKLLGTRYSDDQEKLILQKRPDIKEQIDNGNPAAKYAAHLQTTGDQMFQGQLGVADADGRPIRPDYMSMVDPATGRLQSKFMLGDAESLSPFAEKQLGGINLNTQALEELRSRGLNKGPSSWATLAGSKQGLEELAAKEAAQKQGDRQAASAWNQLAMRGGSSGGERERIAMETAGGTRDALAGVARQGQLDRYGIGLQDEQTKLGILQNLPGMEVQALDPQFRKAQMLGQAKQFDIGTKQDTNRFNLGNLISDTQNRNNYNAGVYSEGMREWAAKKTADAQERAANSGGISYICTAVNKEEPLSDSEMKILDNLKSFSMKHMREKAVFYFRHCEGLVPKMAEQGVDFRSFRPFVKTVIHYYQAYGPDYAADFYWDYLVQVINTYAPEIFVEAAKAEEKKHA